MGIYNASNLVVTGTITVDTCPKICNIFQKWQDNEDGCTVCGMFREKLGFRDICNVCFCTKSKEEKVKIMLWEIFRLWGL